MVEGPSAAGKTTWCRRHAARWLPEPGRWSMDEIRRYQLDRWQQAFAADHAGEVIVLDGDPFRLYYAWTQRRLEEIAEADWRESVHRARRLFATGEYGLADLVLYADPGLSYVDHVEGRLEVSNATARTVLGRARPATNSRWRSSNGWPNE